MHPSSHQAKREILAEIGSMELLLRGKITEKTTSSGKPNGHKCQRWAQGKNQSFHVPDDKLDLYTRAVLNHQRFTELTDQYVALCEQDLLHPPEESKKKPTKR
jgi:hypothetical protein